VFSVGSPNGNLKEPQRCLLTIIMARNPIRARVSRIGGITSRRRNINQTRDDNSGGRIKVLSLRKDKF
jgi:hypothetical protein